MLQYLTIALKRESLHMHYKDQYQRPLSAFAVSLHFLLSLLAAHCLISVPEMPPLEPWTRHFFCLDSLPCLGRWYNENRENWSIGIVILVHMSGVPCTSSITLNPQRTAVSVSVIRVSQIYVTGLFWKWKGLIYIRHLKNIWCIVSPHYCQMSSLLSSPN